MPRTTKLKSEDEVPEEIELSLLKAVISEELKPLLLARGIDTARFSVETLLQTFSAQKEVPNNLWCTQFETVKTYLGICKLRDKIVTLCGIPSESFSYATPTAQKDEFRSKLFLQALAKMEKNASNVLSGSSEIITKARQDLLNTLQTFREEGGLDWERLETTVKVLKVLQSLKTLVPELNALAEVVTYFKEEGISSDKIPDNFSDPDFATHFQKYKQRLLSNIQVTMTTSVHVKYGGTLEIPRLLSDIKALNTMKDPNVMWTKTKQLWEKIKKKPSAPETAVAAVGKKRPALGAVDESEGSASGAPKRNAGAKPKLAPDTAAATSPLIGDASSAKRKRSLPETTGAENPFKFVAGAGDPLETIHVSDNMPASHTPALAWTVSGIVAAKFFRKTRYVDEKNVQDFIKDYMRQGRKTENVGAQILVQNPMTAEDISRVVTDNGWLNMDDVMAYVYLCQITAKACGFSVEVLDNYQHTGTVKPYASFLCTKDKLRADYEDLQTTKALWQCVEMGGKILCPKNVDGNHWILLVIQKEGTNITRTLYDSLYDKLHDKNTAADFMFAETLKLLFPRCNIEEVTFSVNKFSQADYSLCGAVTCLHAYVQAFSMATAPGTIEVDEGKALRAEIGYAILKQHISMPHHLRATSPYEKILLELQTQRRERN